LCQVTGNTVCGLCVCRQCWRSVVGRSAGSSWSVWSSVCPSCPWLTVLCGQLLSISHWTTRHSGQVGWPAHQRQSIPCHCTASIDPVNTLILTASKHLFSLTIFGFPWPFNIPTLTLSLPWPWPVYGPIML